MSGFCGVWSPADPDQASEARLQGMLDAIPHRGPQLRRHFDSELGFALGYRFQPAFLPAGVRPEPGWRDDEPVVALEGSLNPGRAVTETEAAAPASSAAALGRLYQVAPDSFLEGLDGYFSLALWDAGAGRLVLATDRLGNRPVYYYAARGRTLVVFGSELKAVLAHPAVGRTVDRRALAAYLSRGYVPAPLTIIEGTAKVTAGEVIAFEADGSVSRRSYWRAPRIEKETRDLEDWARATRQEITDAVFRIARATPRIGIQLSGGVDSSIVAAVLREAGVSEMRCFTTAWPDAASSQDAVWAARVAERLGLRHEIVDPSEETVPLERVGALLRQFDEPIDSADRAVGLDALCGAAARAGFGSLIDGNDAEQLFSASPDFNWAAARAAGEDAESAEENLLTGRSFSLKSINRILTAPPDGLEDLLRGFMHDYDALLPGADRSEAFSPAYYLRTPMGRFGAFSELIPPLSGAESRRGFRDFRLFELSLRIPNDIKGAKKAGTSKQLLKASFGATVPEIVERKDTRGAPGTLLDRTGVEPLCLRLLDQAGETGLFHADEVKKVSERYLRKPKASARLRFRTLALFLVWHAFYIEGRDPFDA